MLALFFATCVLAELVYWVYFGFIDDFYTEIILSADEDNFTSFQS